MKHSYPLWYLRYSSYFQNVSSPILLCLPFKSVFVAFLTIHYFTIHHSLLLISMDSIFLSTLKCDAALGMKTLFDMLYAPPPKVMLFGDACNSVTDPIAKASRFFHLIQ